MVNKLLLLVALYLGSFHSAHGLAATARKAGGGGFGAKASSASDVTPDTSPEIETLLAVLKHNKADIANVAVGLHPTQGRGLYATKNFSKKQGGQILCKVPSDCALALADPNQAKQSPETLSVAQEAANLYHMYLHDDARRQQFAFYLDTLPSAPVPFHQQTPDFYEPEDLALLEFPRMLQKTQDKLVDLMTTAQSTGIPLADLQYATWLVTSRSIPLAMSSDDETLAEFDDRGQVLQKADAQRTWIRILVPLLDLVNHSSAQPNARLTILDPQKDNAWFALESTRPIAAGQEIRVAYGSGVESSVELLLNYGLVDTNNPVDKFMLQKGGDDCFASVSEWTTTLEEDEKLLALLQQESERNERLETILKFRIQLKKSYESE